MGAIGRIPVSINGVVAPKVRTFQSDKTQTQKVHKYTDGSTDRSEGTPEYKWTLACSIMEDKQAILNIIDTARANREEVNISYELGTEEYMLVNCGVDSESVNSDSDGTADLNLSGVSPERLKVR